MFAVHHGPDGLRTIATRIHGFASRLASELRASGHVVVHSAFFDTVTVTAVGTQPKSSPRLFRRVSICAWWTMIPSRSRVMRSPTIESSTPSSQPLVAAVRALRSRKMAQAFGRTATQDPVPNHDTFTATAQRQSGPLPASARRSRSSARSHDDPTRLVHHEVERRYRDGADQLA